jgi:Family of unknown function (DUF5755)
MAKRCPPGFVCTDNSTIWLVVILMIAAAAAAFWFAPSLLSVHLGSKEQVQSKPHVIVIQQPHQQIPDTQQQLRPDLYPEPVQRYGVPGLPSIASRGRVGPVQQVGILTAEGGSSSSAAPDRTILPLYGRELDPRRSRWNYYTRTDGANPVQVPVRVQNRVCDDDTNGCNEIYSDDSVHVPALGRSFKATVYRKTLF